jgi:hypothetical protein
VPPLGGTLGVGVGAGVGVGVGAGVGVGVVGCVLGVGVGAGVLAGGTVVPPPLGVTGRLGGAGTWPPAAGPCAPARGGCGRR